MEEKIFITFGYFINLKEKFKHITPENRSYWKNKPDGGVWGSPTNSERGWEDWCTMENWNTESLHVYTKWKLKNPEKIFIINSVEDLLKAYEKYSFIPNRLYYEKEKAYIDFHAMKEDGWDGIWLTWIGQLVTREMYENLTHDGKYIDLYGWDCESIVVWNPDQIKILEKGRK